ncbi:hypothetical protein [Agromyces sp. NPDC058104]|uniref:hypothetical protein n=1 Tax=Agromyces sp. NPDC058104 TaxID=3346342 RepID=UPI0036DE6C92
MRGIDGRALGTWSLRLDAIYCVLLGTAVVLSAGPLAELVRIPGVLISTAGLVIVLWAGVVIWLLAKLRIRTALRMVMGVNVLAALLVALCAVAAATLLAVVGVLAVAVDVAAFAVSQALALRTLPGPQGA